MKKFSIYIVGIVAIGVCLVATSCHSSAEKRVTAVEEDTTTLYLALMPCKDCLPLYYAQQMGIFEQMGLNVSLHSYMAQLDTDTALMRHHADVAYTDLIRAAIMENKDSFELKILKLGNEKLTLVASQKRRIKKVKQLKEKMVAVARHSITDYWSDRIMEEAGMERKEIFRPQINSLRIRTDMLCNGTMDAAFLPYPFALEAIHRENVTLMSTEKNSQKITAFAAPASVMKIASKRAQMALLWKAFNKAVEELNTQPTDSLVMLMKRHCMMADTTAKAIAPQVLPFDTLVNPREQRPEWIVSWLQSREQWR